MMLFPPDVTLFATLTGMTVTIMLMFLPPYWNYENLKTQDHGS